MAYDSATATAMAGQAYQRALATAQQKRDSLNAGFGLNADGSMDNTAAGQLGSIYQGNLASVNADQQAELADQRRGFGAGVGGLGGKAHAAAYQFGLNKQAANFANANRQLGGVTQEEQAAGQQYQSDLSNIGTSSAFDLAQTLAANPVYGQAPTSPTAPAYAQPGSSSGLAYKQLFKSNPKRFQTIKGKF